MLHRSPLMQRLNAILHRIFCGVLMLLCCMGEMWADTENKPFKGGWYNWDPYQYLKTPGDNSSLTGLDIELQKVIFKKLGRTVVITDVSWKQHQEDLKTGERDFAMGAFDSKERREEFYVSNSYRFEENSLFTLRKDGRFKNLEENVPKFLNYVKENNLKIGVIEGYRYANDDLNAFISNPDNATFLEKSGTDNQNLSLLQAGKIDGFLADRIVGATIIWREKVGNQMAEKRLNAKATIHMLLSKKTFNAHQAKEINRAISNLKKSKEYTQIVSWYIYPILLLETTDSDWFEVIQQIGIIAFAISGLVLAYRHNASLFGTFLLALLPSFGGGILRDVMFGRFPIWFLSARSYMLTLLFIVLTGFFTTKLIQRFNGRLTLSKENQKKYKTSHLFDWVLTISDALGLAAFTVTGILVSLIIKAEPLWLWGPFFAFLTGAGGGLIRDVVLKNNQVESIHGGLYAEITIFWGTILSLYLTLTVSDVDPFAIKISVIVTIILVFVTRILVYGYGVSNIYFQRQNLK